MMGMIASQITSLTVVYSTVYSDTDQRKHQSSASLAFVRGIHRGLVNSPHKWPVTRKMFPFDDFIMNDIIRHLAAWSTLVQHVQVMACCLFSIRPLFKLMLIYCPLPHLNISTKIIWKGPLQSGGHFISGPNGLSGHGVNDLGHHWFK